MTQKRMKAEKVQLIACGALAREILAVREQAGLTHLDVHCLPAIWHNHPEKIAPGVKDAIKKAREAGFEHIFVAYADCGTAGALDKVLAEENIERIAGPHCYAFFVGNAAFEARGDEDMTSFFLTDFLARQFQAFVIEPLGLDRHPELRDAYFGHYEKLIYLAQTDDAALDEKARAAADRLGLAYERRLTGYGELSDAVLSAGAPPQSASRRI